MGWDAAGRSLNGHASGWATSCRGRGAAPCRPEFGRAPDHRPPYPLPIGRWARPTGRAKPLLGRAGGGPRAAGGARRRPGARAGPQRQTGRSASLRTLVCTPRRGPGAAVRAPARVAGAAGRQLAAPLASRAAGARRPTDPNRPPPHGGGNFHRARGRGRAATLQGGDGDAGRGRAGAHAQMAAARARSARARSRAAAARRPARAGPRFARRSV